MTCAEALESLLQADPSDLAGQGRSPLSQHVRECVRCQRLAGQVLDDTHLLASAVSLPTFRPQPPQPPQPLRRRQWSPVFVIPAALATAIVAIAVLRPREVATVEKVVSLAPVTVAPVSVAVIKAQVDARAETRAPALPASVHLGKAFPPPVPVAPVRLEQPARVVVDAPVGAAQAVAVAPPPGTRAAVLHTSDPKLVVVWLY